jgi:hypothetical protein
MIRPNAAVRRTRTGEPAAAFPSPGQRSHAELHNDRPKFLTQTLGWTCGRLRLAAIHDKSALP